MIVKRMIREYVDKACRHIPFMLRKRLRSKLLRVIYHTLYEICGNEPPTITGVKEALKIYGTPREAAAYICRDYTRKKKAFLKKAEPILNLIWNGYLILTAVLMICGTVRLGIGTGDPSLFLKSLVLAVIATGIGWIRSFFTGPFTEYVSGDGSY